MFNNLKVSGLKFDLPNDLHNVFIERNHCHNYMMYQTI